MPLKPKDLRKIYGFTVGGAIIKNKLFWIYTYDQHQPNLPRRRRYRAHLRRSYTLPNAVPTAGAVCNTATGYADGRHELRWTSRLCTLAARTGLAYAQATRRLKTRRSRCIRTISTG